jgi:hypothetical protein
MTHDPRCRYAWNPREQNCDCPLIARVVADYHDNIRDQVQAMPGIGIGYYVSRAAVLALLATT